MGEDFMPGVIRTEEPHDVAMAVAAIEIVVAIEDHVLGAFDDAKPNRADIAQLVVQRVRRTGIRRRRWRWRRREIGRRDIDLVENLVAVLQPAHVDEHRGDQHDAEDGRVDRPRHRKRQQPVGQDQHDDRAEHRLGDRAAAAAERIAAEYDGGQRRDLEAHAGIGAGPAEPRGVEEAGQAAEHARPDIGVADRAPHADAGIVRRAPCAADRH